MELAIYPFCSLNQSQVFEAQAARRAERETLMVDSRMRGRPKPPEEQQRVKARPMGPPKVLSEEEKARRQAKLVSERSVHSFVSYDLNLPSYVPFGTGF